MALPAVIGLVAGEASGDTLGAHLIQALRARRPGLRFVGIGGAKMLAQGFESWYPQEKLAVRGLVEVLQHVRELRAIRRGLGQRLRAAGPRLVVGIDAPDFNLGLETRLRRAGVRTAHYVSPTVWAWRPGRIHGIARAIDHMLVLFPFEAAIYERAGIKVTYVGHPLADEFPLAPSRATVRAELRLPLEQTVVTLMPGSRQSELDMMAQPFIEAAKLIHAARPNTRFLAPFATRETRALFEAAIYACNARELPITMLFGHAREAMTAADAILVASGTATLEAALTKRPMVVVYRLAPLSYQIAKQLVKIPYVALPNILAGEFLVPEFLQNAATPANLAQAILNQVDDRRLEGRLAARFTVMHHELRRGTAERAADALMPYIEPNPDAR